MIEIPPTESRIPCVAGESGAGKSTPVKTILNLKAALGCSRKGGNCMKKCAALLLALCLVALCAGCGKAPKKDGAKAAEEQISANVVDVDLTTLNSTMVYAVVSDMMGSPENYIEKTVKASGLFNASFYDATERYYYYVMIADAAACCAQGLEFVWKGDHSYPKDYPANQAKIEVIGKFKQYTEADVTYSYLDIDDIKVL
jgi:hypothetical protein